MKSDLIISQEIAAVLKSGYTLGIAHIGAAQSSEDLSRPCLSVTGDWQQYGESFRKGTAEFEFRSRQGDETAGHEHDTMFGKLLQALCGSLTVPAATAKASFKSAIATRAAVNVLDYGPKEIACDVDGMDLRTKLTLNMVWKFV